MKRQYQKVTSFILIMALILGIFSYLPPVNVYAATDVWDGVTVSGAFTTGDGSVTSPYAISSSADLAYLAQSVDAGTSYSGKYFELTNDLDLNNAEWTPIGTTVSWRPFSGIFDGANHTISNVKMSNADRFSGLFGWVLGAEIKNLNVSNVDITSTQPDIGGLIGSMSNCTVSGVTVTGTLEGDGNVGGMIGSVNFNGYPSPFATITSCSAICTVSSSAVAAGGLVGYNVYGLYTSCDSSGTVTGTNQIGGLVGSNNDGRIVQSHSSSTVNASGSYAGGLVGANNYFSVTPEIESSYATGDVTGASSGIGGLVGMNVSALISKSYATGNVSGGSNVGGLVGSNQTSPAKIQSCYATGSILAGSQTGSLVGNVFQAEVVSSYAIGLVSPGATNAGGLAGVVSFSTIAGCFWDTQTTGKNAAFAVGTNNGNIGTTTAIMTADSSIYEAAGWDFASTWQMGTGGYRYPIFGTGSSPAVPPSTPSGGHSHSNSNPGTPVMFNNKPGMTAVGTTETAGDKKVIVFQPETGQLEASIKNAEDHSQIVIPYSGNADSMAEILNGGLIQKMAEKDISFGIEMNGDQYLIPSSAIDFGKIASELNAGSDLSGVQIRIELQAPDEDTEKQIDNLLQSQNKELLMPAVAFTVIAENTNTGEKIDLNLFSDYIKRVVKVPDGSDPSRITTGIIYNDKGTLTPVPTKVTEIDGKYYATVNSRTNGVLMFVSEKASFDDVANHWAKDQVNEMGSRLIVNGIGEDNFAPDREITRAEFSAIMVRALGLSTLTNNTSFKDVQQGAWYEDYIDTAVAAGILKGYGDGTAKPMNLITREEAMAIISRSMSITKLAPSIGPGETEQLLSVYSDANQTAKWAKEDIANCLKEEIVNGSNGHLDPRNDITRAQVAVIVQRLMVKSGLI